MVSWMFMGKKKVVQSFNKIQKQLNIKPFRF